ncbi:MAG TPA: short-chain dehydrogenase/reductase [Solirubrobacterales bacterium]|jgi:NAD(P)-dependent dehydrogenase (short-subunit alcohol dehydrogenase family)|nr:short-chain dehydrogenase/reductase [Solirubrobacterales bacterium]
MPAYDLNGKVALVTGAARGIGYETARQLHLRGASVTVLDIDAAEAREAAERIGPRAIGLATDVTDHSAVMQSVAETVDRFGGLDVVVANAGIAQKQMATVRGIGVEEWERVFEVDMLGVWRTVRAALPQVVERQGHIVVTSSVYAFVNGMLNSPYAVAKSGVESLGRSLRAELTPLGASASVAYFGWVDTKMVQDAVAANGDRMQQNLPEFLRKRITPDQAGAAVVRGIEERAPRIFAPKWWRYVSAFRGLINPLLDGRMDSDRRVLTTIREVEAEADEQGAAAVAAAKS